MNGEKLDRYCHIIDEAIDEFVGEKNDKREYMLFKKDLKGNLDLSSFKPKKEMEPHIWKDGEINPEVRRVLLMIAGDFIETLETKWVEPSDIILTGSLANYNWSEYSDFDLHILIDFSKVDERTDFVKDYYNAKKNEWNDSHEELKLYGYTVEVYVQDTNEEHDSSGVYSLFNNEWIKEPEQENIKAIQLDKYWIKQKSNEYIRKIDKLDEGIQNTDDIEALKILSNKVDKLIEKLKGNRSESLKKNGEMGDGNILYKLIRRTGYLDNLYALKGDVYDKIKSIK